MTALYEDKAHQRTSCLRCTRWVRDDVGSDLSVHRHSMGGVYIRAKKPSSSSLLVGAGSGAPGFLSEMGSLM